MDIKYKQLEKKDARNLMGLRLSVLASDPYSFSVTEDEEKQASEGAIESAIDSYANSRDRLMLGAWEDNDLVGVVGIERYGNKIENHKVLMWGPYVNKSTRGRGIGGALVKKAENFSFSVGGVETITLEASSESKSAISLFKKFGFEETGVQKKALCFDGKYADLLYMQMSKQT